MVEPAMDNLAAGAALGVVPVLIGPLQALIQILIVVLPGLVVAAAAGIVAVFKPSAMKAALKVLWRLKLWVGPVLLGLILLIAAAWVTAERWRQIWGLPAGPAAAQAIAGGEWPMFRGGPQRRGWPSDEPGPTRGKINWVWRQEGERFYSSPAVVGNRVYVASAVVEAFSSSGEIYCFDANSGAVVWRSAPENYQPTFSSPVVVKDYLVCGEGLHDTSKARIICLDLRPGREGKVLWTFTTGSHVECTPVVSDGRVYVGAGDDGYYCLALEGDGRGGAKLLWHLPGKDYPDAETSLVVHEGRVYAGLGLGGKAICILDAATGRELARIPTPHPVFGPPAVAGGKLYICMGSGDYIKSAEELGVPPAGEVWCVDLATGTVEWRFPVAKTILGAAAVAGEEIYFGSQDGRLYCIGRDGKPIGKWDAHSPIKTSPAVTDTHVYFITETGALYALKRRTMAPVWEVKAGGAGCISSPAVARGRAFVGTQDDGFICAGQAGPADKPLWPGRLAGPGAGGNLDDSPIPPTASFHWQYPPDQDGKTKEACVTAPPAVIGENLLVPLAAGASGGLACLPAGARPDQTPPARWVYRTPNGVHISPALVGDLALVVDGRPPDANRRLHAIDAASGQKRWDRPVDAQASGQFVAAADCLFIQDRPDGLTCLDLGGKELWSRRTGGLCGSVGVGPSILVAAVASPPALAAMDRPTSAELWRIALDSAPATSPAVVRTTIFVGTARGLEARSLIDGEPLPPAEWRLEGGGVSGEFVLAGERIAYVNVAGEAVVLARTDGRALVRLPGAARGTTPLISRGRMVYFAEGGKLMKVDLDAADEEARKPAEWADASWLGRATTPMVLGGSNVYVGLAGWGLARLGAGK